MGRRFTFMLLTALTAIASIVVAPTAEAATVSVSMQNFAFNPQATKAVQGSTVQWTQNDAGTQHTATSDQGFWTSGFLSTGQSYSETAAFKNAGAYPYHCE